ncbi:hypothetical protein DICSQDRAFT_172528 [Dichomitus squalens LYAD-421 SS1]|uniref:Uncharacterized protein n=1 Tax=Dichomitus squalens (strain LYAD-421) TaxID=732165 RepID=R7SRQ5_DICSQ|nr:uncharacterized protein DICSQDRAFT_172528 [Dichomitus squalens LYAD-421 SS1]EJF58869.1 hypothetical protein DICSQDRAFT_172528 [Dichomitus squalens LYAD-421 SS1]
MKRICRKDGLVVQVRVPSKRCAKPPREIGPGAKLETLFRIGRAAILPLDTQFIVADNNEDALVLHKLDIAPLKAYSDGTRIDGRVGAAAVLEHIGDDGEVHRAKRHLHVGGESHYTSVITDLSLYSDSKVALNAVSVAARRRPGWKLANFVLNHYDLLLRRHPTANVMFRWIAGHRDVAGHGIADCLAREAAIGGSVARTMARELGLDNYLRWNRPTRKQRAAKKASKRHKQRKEVEATESGADPGCIVIDGVDRLRPKRACSVLPLPPAPSDEPKPHVPHEVILHAASGAGDLEGVKFPMGQACLYYASPRPPRTRLAGEVRLRLLPSLDDDCKRWTDQSLRDAFARGRDLCVLPASAWRVPLLTVWGYRAIRQMLLHEGLVEPAVMRTAEKLGRTFGQQRHGSRVMHSFGQRSVVDSGTKRHRFYFLCEGLLCSHVVRNLCSWNQRGAKEAYQPFLRLICSFELSTYLGHDGGRFVVMRVLNALASVRHDARYSEPQDIPLPRAETLLAREVR